MKIGFSRDKLIDFLEKQGYKEESKNYWTKYSSRCSYFYELKKNSYVYLERESSLKEGWWRVEYKYKE